MRAAVYYNNHDIRVEERPVPAIGSGELLVRLESSGICGSDLMEWYRIHKAPLILGHEISGTIEKAGDAVRDFKSGQRVVCAHHVPCGRCHYCLNGHETVCDTLRKTNFDPGGFCEFLRLPEENVLSGVFILPDTVSFDQGTFVEPLACVMRGQRLAGFKKGKSVLVLGSGIAGLMHILLARAMGAEKIVSTDLDPYRLQKALEFGADRSFSPQECTPEILRGLNQGRLFDLAIVTAGSNAAIAQALESVERGGTILFFAPASKGAKIPLSFNELFWRAEVTLTSSYAASPREYLEALNLIASGKINVSQMITHVFGLEETAKGFSLVEHGKNSIKVIIHPQEK